MKYASILTAFALVAAFAILPGCENEPDASIPSAVQNTTPAAPAPAEAAPAPAEAAPAPAETPAPAEAAPAPAETPAPAAGTPVTFNITPSDDNYIGFIGYKVTGHKEGGWSEYNGTVELANGTIESAKINLTIKMDSLFSVATLLTDTLKNEVWFNIEKFPEATFTSTAIAKSDTGYNVTGDLNLRGVPYNITFPAEITLDGDQLKAKAEFKVLRSAWGMTDTGLLDDVISDDVVINFDVTCAKAS